MKHFINILENLQGQKTTTVFEVGSNGLTRVASLSTEKSKTWCIVANEIHQTFFEKNFHVFQIQPTTQEMFEEIWQQASTQM